MGSSRVFFPGLNGLRFFAAFAVFFTHVELMKKLNGFGSHWIDPSSAIHWTAWKEVASKKISWLSPIIANAGSLGVVFFFVLSGFLITYLLFKEKEDTGTVAIKKFYERRILRIWPLYYLIFILGFFILPHFAFFEVLMQRTMLMDHFWGNFIAYALFVPNLAFAMFTRAMPNIGQSWSIGVEEQFYLIWPLFIRYAKRTMRAIFIFTIGLLLLKALVLLALRFYPAEWLQVVKRLLAMSKIECMSFGGIGAYILFHKKENILKIIYKPLTQIAAVAIIPLLIFFTPMAVQDGVHMAYAASFLVIILNAATNSKSVFQLSIAPLDYLGKISYGIYMYHVMIIGFVLHVLDYNFHLNRDLSANQNVVLYSLSFLLTVIVSSLSYHLFESRFIKLKKKVTTVVSGDDAKTD